MAAEESITMAELNRYEVIKSLLDGRLMNKEAGRSLQLSVRQIQRIPDGHLKIPHPWPGQNPPP